MKQASKLSKRRMYDATSPAVQGFKAVADDGAPNEAFDTGAVRSQAEGKGRFDLLPAYAILRLAQHYENGARKYADRNWEKGLPLSRFVDSALRHTFAFMGGDRSEDHLSAILWNISGYIWTENEIRAGRLPETLRNAPWSDSLPPTV